MPSLTDKIKELARLSKISGEYSQLLQLGMKLIKVQLDAILNYLGALPNGNGEATLYGTAARINHLLRPMIQADLIPEPIIKKLYYLDAKSSAEHEEKRLSKMAFSTYYELKKISLVSEQEKAPLVVGSDLGKTMMLAKLSEQENAFRSRLNQSADLESVSALQRIEAMRQSLTASSVFSKTRIQGKIQESKDFQDHASALPGLVLIGVCLLLVALGIAVSLQAMSFPYLSAELGTFTLLFFGVGALLFYLYYENYVKS